MTVFAEQGPREELLKLTFMPDGSFMLDGRHADDWISYGAGRYHYRPETGEIFVKVESGAYEWPYKGHNDYETLYYAEMQEAYPLYFKIVERGQNTVAVQEYVNFYTCEAGCAAEGLYNTDPIWQDLNGIYNLVMPETMPMRERTYVIESENNYGMQ